MNMAINFKRWNTITGVLVFCISAFIYLATLEPTVSFWDCGEFLSCDSKLEIAHPSGAPMVMLIRRVAAIMGGSDPSTITLIINGTSAIASALTIMFLLWTITWFGRKLLASTWQDSNREKILILIAGFIGSMAYAVSDSFWFSAVEAEVYAMSSLFTAMVFWCILKWEENSDTPNSDRWIMLIAYLFGLSIGVHLLNLLAIPAIVILYYTKRYKINTKNTLLALLVSVLILGSILFIIIPGVPAYFSKIELFTVNGLGLPYNSGFIAGILLLITLIVVALIIFKKRKKIWLYNSVIYFTLIIIGFSSYTAVVVRSHDNPPVDMGNPEDPFSLANYLNREQYGARPLIYGQSFASPVIDTKERNSYQRFQGRYTAYPLNPTYVYDPNTQILFPRMASEKPDHKEAYKQWSDFHGKPYYRTTPDGKKEKIFLPTFGENLTFFFRYQLGFMYFRYFMWNFSGRQNDIQAHGNILYGNWISGIPFIDNTLLGEQEKLPDSLKHNPGRNRYFLLPLLLGLFGLIYHYRKDVKNFSVLALLFFFTGIAIVIFLNEEPVTPRERDYVYVGSFYAFSAWIGIGVLALYGWLKKLKGFNENLALITSFTLAASVPVIMTCQNWDDHDRSGRFVVLEYARNYLESCEPNAILFTNADNDTYPLWYAQEVAGIRRDIQIVLLPYLSAQWYVDQLRKPSYSKPGLKMSLGAEKYIGGQRSYFPVIEKIDSTVELSAVLEFAGIDDNRGKVQLSDGQQVNFIPSHKLSLSTDKSKFPSNQKKLLYPENSVQVSLHGQYLRMDEIVLLDIIASNKWIRPVYFASIQAPRQYGIDNYLQLDGYAYKLTAYKSVPADISEIGRIESDSLYNKLMNTFSFSSLANPKVYLDWTHVSTVSILSLRDKFARLAETLMAEGRKDSAIKVLDRISSILPNERIAYDYQVLRIIADYMELGEKEKGTEILRKFQSITRQNLEYYSSLSKSQQKNIDYEIRLNNYISQEINRLVAGYKL